MWKQSLVILAAVLLISACAPQTEAIDLPEAAQTALRDQIGSENIVIEAVELAPNPSALRDIDRMWCVITSISTQDGEPIYGEYFVFDSGSGWNVSITDLADFGEVGCRIQP